VKESPSLGENDRSLSVPIRFARETHSLAHSEHCESGDPSPTRSSFYVAVEPPVYEFRHEA
jgi:hypothetical protein